MVYGAFGLQIERGLFLWPARDVGKLLQVLDSTCVGCGKLDPNILREAPGGRSAWEHLHGLGEEDDGLRDSSSNSSGE